MDDNFTSTNHQNNANFTNDSNTFLDEQTWSNLDDVIYHYQYLRFELKKRIPYDNFIKKKRSSRG